MRRLSLLICTAAATALGTPAFGGFINYGDFGADTVDFLNVTEHSDTDPEPLFGAPFVTGNSLFFNNLMFAASAAGKGGIDKTRGFLNTTIAARAGQSINSLSFREAGSYTLTGLTNDAFASVAAAYHINVLEIDGMPVDPIADDMLMSFDPSDGDYSIGEDGAGTGLWEGLLTVDIDALLASRGRSGSATRISLIITNTLNALSQEGTSSSIAKKGVTISVIPTPPALAMLLVGAAFGRRRRRV